MKNKLQRLFQKLAGFKVPLSVIFFVLAFFALIFLTYKVLQNNGNKTITVTGIASSTLINKVAEFNVAAMTTNPIKDTAVSETNAKADKIIQTAKIFGINPKDIKTNSIAVYQIEEPFYSKGVQIYRPTDWRANIDINIVLRDISKVEELAKLLSSQDISNLYGPNFSLDITEMDEEKLLVVALEKAYSKASFVAKNSGMRLGSVISIREDNSYYSPQTVYSGKGGAAAESLEPGTTEVSKAVTVSYQLK